MEIIPIAYFHSPLTSKFGIPKQAGIVNELEGTIVFQPAFRNIDAIRGLNEFDYLWIIWQFSANKHSANSLIVRPPRLGGNEKVGVFASRSPFRPNPIGLSSVKIVSIDNDTSLGPVIKVRGADIMDGTPIYDIKPYITFADSHPEAKSGFVDTNEWQKLNVSIPEEIKSELISKIGEDKYNALYEILREDPRPQYQKDPQRQYGMPFESLDIHFRIIGNNLRVINVIF
nr:tRNA (N6-threonylcarbamoyladenosine(37)-N6)-methyltransferase TrmO [Prevotella sp.]